MGLIGLKIMSKFRVFVKKHIALLRAIVNRLPIDCSIESRCKIRKVKMEGRNHIGERCQVFNTKIGYGSGISRDSIVDSVVIGKYTSFGPDVKIVTGQHPTSKIVSTYPAFYSKRAQMGFTYVENTIFDEIRYADEKNNIKVIVGNDVWIGSYVRIIEGVTIGDGAVVAAGSFVTKDIPDYAIVGGVPAKIIRYRFNQQEIDFLRKLKWWNRGEDWLIENAKLFSDIKEMMRSYYE